MEAEPETPVIDINANLFRAAAICASTEDVRAYINCVRVEKHPDEGVLLVATDGCRLIAIHDQTAFCQSEFVAASLMLDRPGLTACRVGWKKGTRLRLARESGIATVGDYTSPGSVIVDQGFPDWRRVVPVQDWKCAPSSFNSDLLASFAKIAAIFDPDCPCMCIVPDGPRDRALVLFPQFADAFGLLMPMYAPHHAGKPGLPRWMKPVMKNVTTVKKMELV